MTQRLLAAILRRAAIIHQLHLASCKVHTRSSSMIGRRHMETRKSHVLSPTRCDSIAADRDLPIALGAFERLSASNATSKGDAASSRQDARISKETSSKADYRR